MRGFYYYRAAWIYHFAAELRKTLSEAEEQEGIAPDLTLLEDKISKLIQELNKYPPDPLRQHLAQGVSGAWTKHKERSEEGFKEKNHSKRSRLRGLPTNWREQMFAGLPAVSKYLVVVAVLSATGARPAEFEKGIEVAVVDVVGSSKSLRFKIWGAKTHGGKYGQEERSFTVLVNRPELSYLHERVSAAGGKLVVNAKAGALSDKIRQLSKKVFPNLQKTVSAYVFRHQFSKDQKSSDLSGVEISAAFGHSVDETKSYYSSARRNRSGTGLRDVQSSKTVIERTNQRVGMMLESIRQNETRDRER